MSYQVKILKTEMLNHNVKHFVTEKPAGLSWTPGQAVLVELPEKKGDKHPFTFTGLTDSPNLEFTIKLYPQHHGITARLKEFHAGDVLDFGDPWGAIKYKGPGLFLAGGAGMTPFLAILRMLSSEGKLADNELWFSNKTDADVFLESELSDMLGDRLRLLVTDASSLRYENARIDQRYLESHVKNFDQYFYICGPDKMVKGLAETVSELGAPMDKIVIEDLS